MKSWMTTGLLGALMFQALGCGEPELASLEPQSTQEDVDLTSDAELVGNDAEGDAVVPGGGDVASGEPEGDVSQTTEGDGGAVDADDVVVPTDVSDIGAVEDTADGLVDASVDQNTEDVGISSDVSEDVEEPNGLDCSGIVASMDPPLAVGLQSAVITVESPVGPVKRTLHFVWPEGGESGDQFPLVLGFHEEVELGATGEQEVAKMWAQSMVGAPIVGVFPEGRVDGTESLFVGWDAWTPMSEKQDVFVVLGILSLMGGHPAVAPDKVYAFGRSGGAAFVGNRLATHPCATEISGFGLFGFPLLDFQFDELSWFEENAPPRAVVIAHGTNDQYVSHTGGIFTPLGLINQTVSFLSIEQTFQAWSLRNGCTTNTAEFSSNANKFVGSGEGCAATTIRFDVLGQGHDFDLDWYQSAGGNDSTNELMVLLGELGL